MKTKILLRLLSGVHLILFFIWTAAVILIVMPALGNSPGNNALIYFAFFPVLHLLCAVRVLQARKIYLAITLALSVLYLAVQIFYGYSAQDIVIALLLVYSIWVSLKYLFGKPEGSHSERSAKAG